MEHSNRPSRAVHLMNLAVEHAKRSTCFRLNVGCLVTSDKDIVALTYNGPPRGEPHCSGHACPGAMTGCNRSDHAEQNALRRITSPAKALDMFITHSPCPKCAGLIQLTQASFKCRLRVFYQTEFREATPLDYLVSRNIEVYKITPAGYITKFPNNVLIDPASLYA